MREIEWAKFARRGMEVLALVQTGAARGKKGWRWEKGLRRRHRKRP